VAQARLTQTIFGLSYPAAARCAPRLKFLYRFVALARNMLLVTVQESTPRFPPALENS
jgi:hypothetical protein